MQKVFISYFLSGVITVFLAINIIASATISPLFAPFIAGDYEATIEYLVRIKKRPEFNTEYAKFKKVFGDRIEERVFSEKAQRSAAVRNFEQILVKNPKSRDILYALSHLYSQEGDSARATYYLQQAQLVDPAIK